MRSDHGKEGFMGVEYQHYLIPEDNTYKPGPEDLSRLVNALVDGGFVVRTGTDTFERDTINTFGDPPEPAVLTGCYVHVEERKYSPFLCPCTTQDIAAFGEADYRIVWTVDSSNESGLRYPLSPFPDWGDERICPTELADHGIPRVFGVSDDGASTAVLSARRFLLAIMSDCRRPLTPAHRFKSSIPTFSIDRITFGTWRRHLG